MRAKRQAESAPSDATPTVRLERNIAALTRRTMQLAVANAKLRSQISRRISVEKSLRASKEGAALLLAKSQRTQQEMRQLSRRLLSVQEEERKRISRELHDVVAQALSAINVHLTLLKSENAATTKELHRKIAVTQDLVKKSVEIVHRFARDLRPAVLDDIGLIPALRSHLKITAAEALLKVSLSSEPGVEALDLPKKTVLYRVFQEALTNIIQHARATKVTIRITCRAGQVHLTIRDNGCGFRTPKLLKAEAGAHLGLLGMRERVEMSGGTFSVESIPRKSTTIRVDLPLDPIARRRPNARTAKKRKTSR